MKILKNFAQFLTESLLLEIAASGSQIQAFKKWVLKHQLDPTEAESIQDRFFKHYQKLKKKDINTYRDVTELLAAIETAESFKTASEEKKAKKKEDAIKGSFGKVDVILCLTPASSQFYGAGTTWCTGAKNEVFHWLLHRMIGVEFYLINHALPETDNQHKLSIHLNWNKRYITVYDALNTPTFNGEVHEYTDPSGLAAFLHQLEDGRLIFEWILKEFEATKADSPHFLPQVLRSFCTEGLDTVWSKYLVDDKSADSLLVHFDHDVLNEVEYENAREFLNSKKEGFRAWLATRTLVDIQDLLAQIEEFQKDEDKKIALDDHVVICEFFTIYCLELPNFRENFYEQIPVIFDADDETWYESIIDETEVSEEIYDDLEDQLEFIQDGYNTATPAVYAAIYNMHPTNRLQYHIYFIEALYSTT